MSAAASSGKEDLELFLLLCRRSPPKSCAVGCCAANSGGAALRSIPFAPPRALLPQGPLHAAGVVVASAHATSS